jgi:hypothetical protein
MRRPFFSFLLISALLSLLTACGAGSDKTASTAYVSDQVGMVGIWHVKTYQLDGQELGDAKAWFEFRKDGGLSARINPLQYQEGRWEIDSVEKTMTMLPLDTVDMGTSQFTYTLKGDSLELVERSGDLPNKAKAICVRVSDYPVTQKQETTPSSSH